MRQYGCPRSCDGWIDPPKHARKVWKKRACRWSLREELKAYELAKVHWGYLS